MLIHWLGRVLLILFISFLIYSVYYLNKAFGGGDPLAVLGLRLTKQCSGCDLKYANLKYANLTRADLSKAQLDGANLSHANLSFANLQGASTSTRVWVSRRPADFSYANFSGANLSHTRITDSNLSNANFSKADLRASNLKGSDLSHTNLSDADLTGAKFDNRTKLKGSIINEQTKLDPRYRLIWKIVNQGAREFNLKEIDFRDVSLSGIDFRGADLEGVNLNPDHRADLNYVSSMRKTSQKEN
ncbi:MAG: hypothetical protein CLLPBCKN_002393 [Chroococcidiopsis cubana SAG 39.79]|nr:hypothetical protein [Chroococcidiopsis cubana SAG 39.79]PSB66228.1 hypothetical protein C7B79_01925 [Chroococcidiopsis cubana CCALA 043]